MRLFGIALVTIVLVLVVFAVVLIATATLGIVVTIIGGALLCVLVIVVIVFRWRAHTHECIRRVFDVPADTPPAYVLSCVLEEFHRHGEEPSRALLHFVSVATDLPNAIGTTFLASPQPPSEDLNPIEVPFEPRPLDEFDDSFAKFRDALAQSRRPTDDASSVTGNENSAEPRWTWRRLYKISMPWLTLVFFVTMFGPSWGSLLVFFVLFGLVVLMRVAYVLTRPRDELDPHNARWMLVPGGLLLMSPRRGSTKWNLHVFDRRTSVLIAYATRDALAKYTVLVAERGHFAWRNATDAELDVLLRAWISPLPPPGVERLAEFTAT